MSPTTRARSALERRAAAQPGDAAAQRLDAKALQRRAHTRNEGGDHRGACAGRRRHRARPAGRKRNRRRPAQPRPCSTAPASRSGALTVNPEAPMTSRAALLALALGCLRAASAAVRRGAAAKRVRRVRRARRRSAGRCRSAARREDHHGRRLRRGRLHERRRQHLGVAGRATEVGEHSGIREDHRSRARPDAGAAAQPPELRLRGARRLSRRAESGGRHARRRRRLQRGARRACRPGGGRRPRERAVSTC